MPNQRTYIAIDLKSFYASVECVERGLDPLTANLVVADPTRTEKTICLAVSPSLKAYGISGRARLFDVVQRVREVNRERQKKAPGGRFRGESSDDLAVRRNPSLKLGYIVAPPQMAHYIDISTKVHQVYLKYIAPEDMHVYSIDEVFMDVTAYLGTYKMSAHDLAMKMISDVLATTGITATAGIGSNMYLCKVAMDIMAKHIPADENGVRIAQLDEMSYRQKLWSHEPLTDFWRVGHGYADRLKQIGIFTMGDIALLSTRQGGEDWLFGQFGVNAELLIDHAWGWEPCGMKEIKAYRPTTTSLSSGQVLKNPYPFDKARLVTKEMTELLSLDLVEKQLVTDQVTLTVGYDRENLVDSAKRRAYKGEVHTDHYGRLVPKHAHGTENLSRRTSSTRLLCEAVMRLFDRVVDPRLTIRRICVTACKTVPEGSVTEPGETQLTLFDDPATVQEAKEAEDRTLAREKRLQKAELAIKHKYGKNAILKGMNFEEGATAMERNSQIGGHKA